jgi:hypothetical protein
MILARATAIALALCLCFASGSSAAQTGKLKVTFNPDRAGARTTIGLELRISGAGGGTPSPVTSLDLRMPANMGFATTTLGEANCTPAALFAAGLNGCSPNARIGLGTATAVVPIGAQIVDEKATLQALMGEAGENRVEVLFYLQAARPVFAQLVLPSVLQEATPPYGERLDTSVPLVQAWPEGPDLSLETFNSTIGPLHLTYRHQVGGKTVSFKPRGIRIPRICPAGGYPFSAVLAFKDGTQSTADYRVPCPDR